MLADLAVAPPRKEIEWSDVKCPTCGGWMMETTASVGRIFAYCQSARCRASAERVEHEFELGSGDVVPMRKYRCKSHECAAELFRSNCAYGVVRGNCPDRRCKTRYYVKLGKAGQG